MLSKLSVFSALGTPRHTRFFSTSTVLWAATQRAPRPRKQNIVNAVKTAATAGGTTSTRNKQTEYHEVAFTVPRGSAKEAFNALFAENKTATAAEKETADNMDGAEQQDFQELQAAEEELSASHGEEELVEMRDGLSALADDMDDVDEATPASAAQTEKATTAPPKDKDGEDDAHTNEPEEPSKENPISPKEAPPVNECSETDLVDNHGQAYVGDVAETIHHFAEDKNFKSNIWASRASFKENNVAVNVQDEDGVSIHIGNRSTVLFNLDQTDYAAAPESTSALSDLRYRTRRNSQSNHRLHAPLDLRGLLLPRNDRANVMKSPLFGELHRKAALWVNVNDMRNLGAEIRPEEKQRYCYSPATRPAAPLDAAAAAWVSESLPDLDLSLLQGGHVWYNISQLHDEARFAPYYQNREYFTPRSWSGRRYSPSYAFLLREYCLRFGFPVDDRYVVFVPIGRIRSQGGTVLDTPRNTPTGPAVPPPFTLIMNDDSIVSVYNALQTDIAESLIENAEKMHLETVKKYATPTKYVSDFSATVNEIKYDEEE